MEKSDFDLNEQTINELEGLGIHIEKREDFFLVVGTGSKNDKFDLESDLKQLTDVFYDQMNDGYRVSFTELLHLRVILHHHTKVLKARTVRIGMAKPEKDVREFAESVQSDFRMWKKANNIISAIPSRVIVINIIPEKSKFARLKGIIEFDGNKHAEFLEEVYKRAKMRGLKLYEMPATKFNRLLVIPSMKQKLFDKMETTKQGERKPIADDIRALTREYEEIEIETLGISVN